MHACYPVPVSDQCMSVSCWLPQLLAKARCEYQSRSGLFPAASRGVWSDTVTARSMSNFGVLGVRTKDDPGAQRSRLYDP
jgi:hypothetical protein